MANKKSAGRGKSSRKGGGSAVKMSKKTKKTLIALIAAVIAVAIIAGIIIYFFFPNLFQKVDEYLESVKMYYSDSADDDPEGQKAQSSAPVPQGELADIAESEFSIHFLELGNKYAGDCTLIKCGDTEVLIDAGSRKNSAGAIKSYVDQYCTDGKLEYVIATHAHQDHIAGFVGSGSKDDKDGILYKYQVGTLIYFSGHNTTSGIYTDFIKAVEYAQNGGAQVYTAAQCWNMTDGAQRQYDLSVAGDKSLTLNILYNYYYENETADENDYSVCTLLTHTDADNEQTHYLFTGDLEGEGESKMVDYYTSAGAEGSLPKVKLFKGAHHGSKTSSTDKLLSIIQPENVAVCCCAGSTEYTSNNDNTFPTQDFANRISKYTQNVYCTSLCTDYKAGKFGSMNGNIVFYYDAKQENKSERIKLWCSDNTTVLKDTEWFATHRKFETTNWLPSST